MLAASYISRMNCAEIAADRSEQTAYKSFRIKRTEVSNLVFFQNALFCSTLYADFLGGRTDAVARHVSFAQITCLQNC